MQKMKSKANFLNPRITASTCKGDGYINSHPRTHKKSKPNPNPIQTQSKANSKTETQFSERTAADIICDIEPNVM